MKKSIKLENYVPIADMLDTSLTRDLTIFNTEIGSFNEDYLAAFRLLKGQVRELDQANTILQQQKVITKKLYAAADAFKKPLSLFLQIAKKTDIDLKLIKGLTADLTARNIEGAMLKMTKLKQIIEANESILVEKGMKNAFSVVLEDTFNIFMIKSNEQNTLMSQRKLLVSHNSSKYDELYEYISDICATGKILFKGEVKADEYIISKIIKRLRANG